MDPSQENSSSNNDQQPVEITKAMTAYQFFQKLKSTKIKEELISNAQDASVGAVTQAVSNKWKNLTESERYEYEELARIDKERYDRESEARNEEVLRLQEERRRQNAMTETESRMRNSTMMKTETSHSKADAPKRKREVSEREREASELRKQAKQEEENAIQEQHMAVSQSKAAQAEARLKYLLNQSDIFAHFGLKAKGSPTAPPAERVRSGPGRKKGSTNSSSGGSLEVELDEDELAMREEEEESESGDQHSSHSMTHVTTLTRQPSCITGSMRPYQLEGLNWMIRLTENGINGILADEMGLGKTLQSISMLGYLSEYKNIVGPHLVVVPKSTLSNWMNEFQRWCPTLRPLRFHGNKEERAEFIQTHLRPAVTSKSNSARDWDILITTYEIFNSEKTILAKIAWRFIIIDEAHRLKNEASLFSTNIRLLTTEHRLLLTGTPLQNNLHELWALLNFLLPEIFTSSEQFDEWFNLDVDDQEAKQRMINQLHKILRPFMLRRLKIDVEKTLPPKTETILFTGLSITQKNVYRQLLLRDIDQINTNFGNNSNSTSNATRTAILNIVMQLRKCCNHPYLFPGVEDRNENPYGEHLINNCGKMVLLDKLLKKLYERNHRVLIFSQMTRMLDILEDYCSMREFHYCRIDGNTSYDDREDRIAEYNSLNSQKFIFLLSTRAGGLGINLQTADTVIIYDSDWNPQADLQAQDRCHRIGQTKQVHVYRLVTDDTVEVKVVERAQQKLKLDAMVVQQGRLADSNRDTSKKMSKNELLETLKFGADKIFRTKDSSSITDEDIDIILEMGRKRTEELNEKLQIADKGDLYDFRLDGGSSGVGGGGGSSGIQIFEGKDYSDKSLRDGHGHGHGLNFIDTGPRERKTLGSYNDSLSSKTSKGGGGGGDGDDKKQIKLPRHLRLPKMEDWQFYSRERLIELQEMEVKLFEALVERGETPPPGTLGKLILLSDELQEEKLKLLSEAFGDWNKNHFNNFIKASAKYGRKQFQKISEEVGRPVDDILKYAAVFWSRGSTSFPPTEWEKVIKAVEKGEKRLEEIDRLTHSTARLVGMFQDPWEELVFKNVGGQGRLFNAIEDRYLLCLTHLHGYGNWDRVRSSIRRCERFRFDYYLLSCTSEALGKRCESLMRLAEREIIEIDRKQQAIDSANHMTTAAASILPSEGSTTTATTTTAEDHLSSNERMAELVKQIAEEARRLANTRAELQKAKKQQAEMLEADKPAKGTPGKKSKAAATSVAPETVTSTSDAAATAPAESTHKGIQKMSVPESLIPELCRQIVGSGADGVTKIVTKFVELHPSTSKRQVEMKINELAIKEKRATDSQKVWHLRREFEYFLESAAEKESTTGGAASVVTSTAETKKKSETTGAGGKKRKAGGSVDTPVTAAPVAAVVEKNQAKQPPASVSKKSRGKESSAETPKATSRSSSAAAAAPTTPKPEKKVKTAFEIFVKEKRAEVEETLGSNADKDALKRELKARWLALSEAEQESYEKRLESLPQSSNKRSSDPASPDAEIPKKKSRVESK